MSDRIAEYIIRHVLYDDLTSGDRMTDSGDSPPQTLKQCTDIILIFFILKYLFDFLEIQLGVLGTGLLATYAVLILIFFRKQKTYLTFALQNFQVFNTHIQKLLVVVQLSEIIIQRHLMVLGHR